jgi:hypothetical protein
MMSVIPAISTSQFDYSISAAGATHTPAKSSRENRLEHHKKADPPSGREQKADRSPFAEQSGESGG